MNLSAGIIGGGRATPETTEQAYCIGQMLARRGYTLVCGGLGGVMEAASHGAYDGGGTVIGILPGPSTCDANRYVTHAVATNMGHARNVIIAHTADFLVAIGGEEGTLSEIAIGLKLGKKVYSIGSWDIPGVMKANSPESLERLLLADGSIAQD